jgi:hypothetical protein
MNAITFPATVYKVQTMEKDLGIRVTLDLSEDNIPEMAMLAECRRQGIPLIFTASVEGPQLRENNGNDRQRRKR